MKQATTLIVGASISGLASAACLQRKGVDYFLIEKESQIASPWRNHYLRLHLHTNKRVSNLPYKKFDKRVPRYPGRLDVIEYLEEYCSYFNLDPLLNTTARRIRREGGWWITETDSETFASRYVVMATGAFGCPKAPGFTGMNTFPGKILHSYEYCSGAEFKGQEVLVVGFGNSACEIAIDLYEQGAKPSMAVRSPVNIVSRDILGIPILEISQVMNLFPPKVADILTAPLRRLLVGDISKLGLTKMQYGPFEQIQKNGTTPVLDIGTIKHIREGHIKIYGDIVSIDGSAVYFSDGASKPFDAIIAAIGYYRDYGEILEVDESRFEDLRLPASYQKYFGKDGLYFCGFWVGPTGQIHEIASDAKKIAKDISRKMI